MLAGINQNNTYRFTYHWHSMNFLYRNRHHDLRLYTFLSKAKKHNSKHFFTNKNVLTATRI